MGLLDKLYEIDRWDGEKNRHESMRNHLEEERKTDPILDQMCSGKMSMKAAVKSIENHFKGMKKYRFKVKPDPEFNELVNYVVEHLNVESDILETGKNHYKKKVDLSRIMDCAGASYMLLLSAAFPIFSIVGIPAAIAGVKNMFDPEFKMAKNRKNLFKKMALKAEMVDLYIESAYGRTEDQKKKKEEKKYAAYKGKDLGDIMGE